MGAPYRRASVVCVDDAALLCVRLRDPLTRALIASPPGGGIEPGETPVEAALRETLEETGYDVHIDAGSERVLRYPYTWAGKTADVQCHLFTARLAGTRALQHAFVPDPIQEAVVWLPRVQVAAGLGYLPIFRDAVLALCDWSA